MEKPALAKSTEIAILATMQTILDVQTVILSHTLGEKREKTQEDVKEILHQNTDAANKLF